MSLFSQNKARLGVVGSLGFAPRPPKRRLHSIVSSRAASLFSLLGCFQCQVKSLAGDELDEPKDSQLPTLREDSVRRPLERAALFETGDNQVSSMWLSENLERWEKIHAFGRVAALQVSKLCLSIFKVVTNRLPLFPYLEARR